MMEFEKYRCRNKGKAFRYPKFCKTLNELYSKWQANTVAENIKSRGFMHICMKRRVKI